MTYFMSQNAALEALRESLVSVDNQPGKHVSFAFCK